MDYIKDPRMIEDTSMDIIENLLPHLKEVPFKERQVLKRIIHTTGDVNILELIEISPGAVDKGIEPVKGGKNVFTDVQMLAAGINKHLLDKRGGQIFCLIKESETAEEAKALGITRAMAAMRRGAPLIEDGIACIGNAPTALFELIAMVERGEARPALVIGTPVGFVGARESKELLVSTNIPYITIKGNRGGSTIAVAALNAILRLAENE